MFNIFSRDDSRNQPKDEVTQLPISKIVPNKYQPRNIFNDEKILELSNPLLLENLKMVMRSLLESDVIEHLN